MRPIVIKNFLPNEMHNKLYLDCINSKELAHDESDPTYKLKRFVFGDVDKKLHNLVMDVVKPHVYDNFSFQFMQYDYDYRTSFVYRDTDSDFDPAYHSDMKGGTFNGSFMNTIIYLNTNNSWSGGDFGYKDYDLDNVIKVEDNMCVIIPAGLRHKIYPVTHGIRRSINLEFKIKL